MATFVQRMVGAAKLDAATYEEVEADKGATNQAVLVVLLAAVAAGVGEVTEGGEAVIGALLGSLIGWVVWAFLTWLIGTKFLPGPQTQADVGQLLRTIGFAATPGLFRVFGWIPILGPVILIAAWLWMLATTVIAVRQALDYTSTGKAILVCVIGWIVYAMIFIWTAAFVGFAIIGVQSLMAQ